MTHSDSTPLTPPEERFWPSPWGFDEDSQPPDRRELFPTPGSERPNSGGMEDFLQHNAVFINGVTGKTCHSDSYMTLMNYTAADYCASVLEAEFAPTKEEWQLLVDLWLGNPNQQPPLRLFALGLVDRFGLARTKVDAAGWRIQNT